MKFQYRRDLTTNATHYYLVLEDADVAWAPLDQFDRMLIKECEGSKSIADKLLALECIARKIEEAEGVPQP